MQPGETSGCKTYSTALNQKAFQYLPSRITGKSWE